MKNTDVRIASASVLNQDPTWSWDMEGYDRCEYLFWVITGGEGELVVDGNRYALSRGDCMITSMGDSHHGRQSPNALLSIPWAVFTCVEKDGSTPRRPSPVPRRHRRLENTDFVEELAKRMVSAYSGSERPRGEANLWLRAAIVEALAQDARPDLYGEQREQYTRIEELAARIRRAPGASYTLDSLADTMHYSPDHLVRLFSKYLHTTPVEYIIRCRLERARHLLLFTSHSVSAIAEALGYASVSYFSRQFTQRCGVSPLAYRRNPGMR
jgi:AraC family transcriptional regulator of arabinose operon